VSEFRHDRWRAPFALALMLAPAALLSGCSSRDEVLSEKVAAAEAAAQRAIKAQHAAERAAKAAGAKINAAAQVTEAEPEPDDAVSDDGNDDDYESAPEPQVAAEAAPAAPQPAQPVV